MLPATTAGVNAAVPGPAAAFAPDGCLDQAEPT